MGTMDFDLSWDTVFNWGDPVIGVHRTYDSSNIAKGDWSNTQGYSNARVDELMQLAAVENDMEKRKARMLMPGQLLTNSLSHQNSALPYCVFDKIGLQLLEYGNAAPIDMVYLKD